jgi:precorrin-2 dehydrogenase / sirohydrochlorin ferrochelatase
MRREYEQEVSMTNSFEEDHHEDGDRRIQPYIACLDLAGRRCVVVGGGSVAARTVASLLDSAAVVRVVAPAAVERLVMLAQVDRIELLARPYTTGDLEGALLAFAATDRADVNALVAQDAKTAGVLCNVADASAASDFTIPAVLRRGDLAVAVSTGGSAPGYARRVRDLLAVGLGPEYGQALELYASVRARILAADVANQPYLWDSLFALELPRVIHDRGQEAASTMLSGWLRRQRLG